MIRLTRTPTLQTTGTGYSGVWIVCETDRDGTQWYWIQTDNGHEVGFEHSRPTAVQVDDFVSEVAP